MTDSTYKEPVSKLLTYGSCLEIDKRTSAENKRRIQEMTASKSGSVDFGLLSQLKSGSKPTRWPNYVQEFSLSAADIPALIQMVTDEELNWASGESTEVWAPTHAWRALGQLRAKSAVDTLIGLLVNEERG
ncbi:MAG: hypothetical protein AAFO84_04260 [Cyanobacteria bacterium J06598_1]